MSVNWGFASHLHTHAITTRSTAHRQQLYSPDVPACFLGLADGPLLVACSRLLFTTYLLAFPLASPLPQAPLLSWVVTQRRSHFQHSWFRSGYQISPLLFVCNGFCKRASSSLSDGAGHAQRGLHLSSPWVSPSRTIAPSLLAAPLTPPHLPAQ